MHVHHQRGQLESLFLAASLLLLFATSFTNPLVIVALAAGLLLAGAIFVPHLRERGLVAAGLAFLAAVVLVRLAQAA